MIKLYKIDELSNGTERFCTQLGIGKGVASFVREKGGHMKFWRRGKNGFNFYKFNEPFEIAKHI